MLALAGTASAGKTRDPIATIESSAFPPGQVCCVNAVDVDQSSGDLFVVDPYAPPTYASGAVYRFDSSGAYDGLTIDGSTTPQGTLGAPSDVAIDPTSGNVYVFASGVVSAFDDSGALVASFGTGGQLDGSTTPLGSFGFQTAGLAVDADGNLFVADSSNNRIWIFSDTGAYLGAVEDASLNEPGKLAVGVDSLYVRNSNGSLVTFGEVNSLSYAFDQILVEKEVVDVALHPATGNFLTSQGGEVSAFVEYSPGGTAVGRFGTGIGGAYGPVAVDGSADRVYAGEFGPPVRVFGPMLAVPDVTTVAATGVDTDSATLNGTVNPDGPALTNCFFEYGLDKSYGSTAPCSPTPGGGTSPVAVSADVGGLVSDVYHYRLVAENENGTVEGADRTFAIAAAPEVLGEAAAPDSDGALLRARIHPRNATTRYRIEYGPTAAFGVQTADRMIQAGNSPVFVEVPVSGLSPSTTYHFRVVASNSIDEVAGPGGTFTTGSGASSAVRHYEMVTPPDKGDNDVGSRTGTARISTDGERVAYLAPSPFPGSEGGSFGSQYLAERSADGWVTTSISPPQLPNNGAGNNLGGAYFAFDPELSLGIHQGWRSVLTDDFPESGLNGTFYRRDLRATVSPWEVLTPLDPELELPNGMGMAFGEATPDLDHVSMDEAAGPPLTPDAPVDPPGLYRPHAYLWSASAGLRFIAYLPEGSKAPFSSATNLGDRYARAIAEDGSSAMFVTSPDGPSGPNGAKALYLWRDGDPTREVSRSRLALPEQQQRAELQAATADHSRIFFTTRERLTANTPSWIDDFGIAISLGSLYMYEPETDQLTALTTGDPAGAHVLGALGMSDDGTKLYFAAVGKLAPGAVDGKANLYLWEQGEGIEFITTFADQAVTDAGLEAGSSDRDNWDPGREMRASRVTADGDVLLFVSRAQQTDYDNAGRNQVYLYDAVSDTVSCASCRPDGAPPTTHATVYFVPQSGAAQVPTDYLSRNLSADGERAFFDTAEALVPEDVNGAIDVYEYSDGRARLVSPGSQSANARFADATPDGSQVAFTTRQKLSGWDTDDYLDLYVRRAGSGFPEPEPGSTPCGGEGCRGLPTMAPVPAPIGSAAFSGPDGVTARDCTALASRARQLAKLTKGARVKANRAGGKRQAQLERKARQLRKKAAGVAKRAKHCKRAAGETGN